MAVYELWLDESGNFKNDDLMEDSPSLVGAFL